MSQYTQTQKAQQVVDAWNKKYGIGEAVLVKRTDGEVILGETRSKAFVHSNGEAVVLLVGFGSAYPVDRVDPVKRSQVVDPALGTSAFIALGNPPYQTTFSVEDGTQGCKHSWGPTKSTNVGIYRVCSLCDKWDIEVV